MAPENLIFLLLKRPILRATLSLGHHKKSKKACKASKESGPKYFFLPTPSDESSNSEPNPPSVGDDVAQVLCSVLLPTLLM